MAYLSLAETVNAAEPLLDAVRVPRQVVVDHEVGTLEVDAFACGVGGYQDRDGRIIQESVLPRSAVIALDPAVDFDDGLRVAKQATDLVDQVREGIAVFGENDEL